MSWRKIRDPDLVPLCVVWIPLKLRGNGPDPGLSPFRVLRPVEVVSHAELSIGRTVAGHASRFVISGLQALPAFQRGRGGTC